MKSGSWSSYRAAGALGPQEPDDEDSAVFTPGQIRAIRKTLGLSVAAAAKKVGVAASTWYGWEDESLRRRPSPQTEILIGFLRDGKL